jgi:uncharacterized membrane-anchored protein
MAEIQQTTNSADLTQRFIEFVMMNAQQAALCLGQIAHPSTGKAEVNLPAAKMFIDHLEIIHEKTRGNLTKDEEKILASVLSELQLAFVQVSNTAGAAGHVHDENCSHGDHHHAEDAAPKATAPTEAPKAEKTPAEDPDGKKKFSKSYGA